MDALVRSREINNIKASRFIWHPFSSLSLLSISLTFAIGAMSISSLSSYILPVQNVNGLEGYPRYQNLDIGVTLEYPNDWEIEKLNNFDRIFKSLRFTSFC